MGCQGKKNWYVGFFIDKNEDGTYRIDHLERTSSQKIETWQRPIRDDIQSADEVQILPIKIVGNWEFKKERPCFNLHNVDEITYHFSHISKLFNLSVEEE